MSSDGRSPDALIPQPPASSARTATALGVAWDAPSVARVPMPVWLCFGVSLLAFGALCALVVLRTTRFWYDESWYLASVESMRRHGGLSVDFLRSLPGPAGPLYTWVHALLAPITKLKPLPTRFATIFMFVLTLVALSWAGRASGLRLAPLRVPQLLGAPMLYGTIGTALTEVPALLAFSMHVCILLIAVRWSERNRTIAIGLGLLSGLCCGLAITGRQTFLPALGALPVLGWRNRATWWPLVVCAVSALVLPALVFAAWGGLTPPKIAIVDKGFSIANLFMAFAYAGLVYAVFDASWIAGRARLYGAIVLTGLVMNLAFGLIIQVPLSGSVGRWLSPSGMSAYGRFSGGLFLGWGLVFMTKLVRVLREPNSLQRYLVLASILILSSALGVNIPYGGRYIAGSLPLLLLVALHRAPDTKWKAVRLAVAAVVGLVSLNNFIVHALRFNDRGEVEPADLRNERPLSDERRV
jgi:hypothetical protein